MMLPDRVAFVGKMGVGKSHAAAILQSKGWEIKRFADPLKTAAREFQDKPTRHLLQELAQVSRRVSPHPLLERMKAELLTAPDRVVVDDARFPDEVELLTAAGFKVVRLTAPVHLRVRRLEANGKLENAAQMNHESELALDTVGLPELAGFGLSEEDFIAALEAICEMAERSPLAVKQ